MPATHALAPLAGAALRLQPDSRLVKLAREGQEPAFEEIVRRYRPALVAYARGFAPEGAEDIVQDGLVSAFTALHEGESDIALRPWLYTIVRNRALNYLRDSPSHELLDDNYDGVPQPPDIAESREQLAGLVAGLKALPSTQREAIVRRELEGASHTEIASALGTSRGAVRQLIFRARITLRDACGLALPLPLLRMLLESEGARLAAAASGGTAAAGVLGATAGGGATLAGKAGAALAVAVLAVGSGVALHESGKKKGVARGAEPERAVNDAGVRHSASLAGAVTTVARSSGERSDSSGPGSGDDREVHGSGTSAGDDQDDDSGPESHDDLDRSGSGSSGSGSGSGGHGSDDSDEVDEDHSGPGGGSDGEELEEEEPEVESSGSSGSSDTSGHSGSSESGSGSDSGSSGEDSDGSDD